ncbi:hypothetical protein KSP40_PGU010232 [Platanthera guangdongensis]|uniref:RNA pseudouridine synthase n=1 Tax=Platanthera guangdongensis TaxID=2320717 RepID=A0ABR2LG30_9ASPA
MLTLLGPPAEMEFKQSFLNMHFKPKESSSTHNVGLKEADEYPQENSAVKEAPGALKLKRYFSFYTSSPYKSIGSSFNSSSSINFPGLEQIKLRVHCAEVLRTPIVGDYKYGGHAHRKWAPMATDNSVNLPKEELPFGLEFEGGSISEKQPRLHLHCRQMVLPNIAGAVERLESASNCDLAGLDELDLVASLPPYMQLSWDVLGF